jgi:hypothetical protein
MEKGSGPRVQDSRTPGLQVRYSPEYDIQNTSTSTVCMQYYMLAHRADKAVFSFRCFAAKRRSINQWKLKRVARNQNIISDFKSRVPAAPVITPRHVMQMFDPVLPVLPVLPVWAVCFKDRPDYSLLDRRLKSGLAWPGLSTHACIHTVTNVAISRLGAPMFRDGAGFSFCQYVFSPGRQLVRRAFHCKVW